MYKWKNQLVMELWHAIANVDVRRVQKLLSDPTTVVKDNMLDVAYYHMTKSTSHPHSVLIFSWMVKDERVNKNYQDSEGNTVLHKACMISKEWDWPFNAIVRKRKNVNPNLKNDDGVVPLDLVIDNPIKVCKLLRCGAELSMDFMLRVGNYPLVLKKILEKHPDVFYT